MISIRDAFINHGYSAEFAFGKEANQDVFKGAGINQQKSKIDFLKRLVKKWPWLYYSLVFKNYFSKQDKLLKDLKKGKSYDLIVEFHTVGSRVGAELAKYWGAKYSVIFDSPVDEQFLEMHKTKSFFWNRIKNTEKKSMQSAEKLMFYSPACRDHVQSKYQPKGKAYILPSLLNKPLDYERKPTEKFNIGFIGSFLSWHKIDLFVKVFNEFAKDKNDVCLQLIGFGQEWHNVKELVGSLELKEKVYMPGFVSEEELSELKSGFTIAAMPGSNWYGSPLKLFEYAQGGIPFIAPVSATVQSVFENGVHCLNVEKNNEFNSLLKNLEKFYSDQYLREKQGISVKEYVFNNFNKETYSKKLIGNLGF